MSLAAAPTSVLTVEDDPIIRADLRLVLETAGFDVCPDARDGVEAIELAREHEPDVILLDLGLPRLGGVEATRRILAHRDVPIVALTGMSGAARRRSDRRRRHVRRPQAVRRRGRGARVARRRHRAEAANLARRDRRPARPARLSGGLVGGARADRLQPRPRLAALEPAHGGALTEPALARAADGRLQ